MDYYGDDHGGPHDNLNQGGTGAAGEEQGAEGFQLTVYDPAFQTPDWLQDAVVYQIFPDRFRNGDPSNDYCRAGGTTGCPLFYGDQDVLLREPWNSAIGDPRTPGPYFNEYGTQFYGGDLQGLIDKLDYLKAAGFDTIYTTPIFDGSSNHRYDTDDYMEIDPALGTLADFNELITELEARDMYLIVDGVFNHTSSDSVYFDRYGRYGPPAGACETTASPYRDWYKFVAGDPVCDGEDYEGWFGYDTLAVLVDESSEVRDYIYRDTNSVMETWYDRGVHGWRFDVADEISHDWWRDFRPYAKADAPNGPLVGEVWPDASAFLLGDQLDSVMNYRFRKNVLGFVRQAGFEDNDNNGNNEIISLTPSQFDRALRSVREDYPPEATAAMLNLLDSHDTNRLPYLMEILGESEAETLQRQKLAAVFQYTYMGAPMVYYGDEVALDSPSLANHVTNGPEDDPYNRAPYPWADEAGDDDLYGPADADMLAFYSRLAEIRQQYPFLVDGPFQTLLTGDTTSWTSADDTTYAFVRYNGNNYHDRAYVVLNPGSSANTAELYVDFGMTEDLLSGAIYSTPGGYMNLTLPPRSAAILVRAAASVAVEKVVDGNSTGLSDWQFSVNGNNGYTLPPAGGDFSVTNIITGTTTVAETDLPGWEAAVSCDNGSSGTDEVSFNLDTGEDVRCTFTNTLCQPGRYDDGAACTPTDPGYYTDVPGAVAPIACVPGYYQPAAGQTSCLQADAGFYAPGPAATEQTACPIGTTSPAGSDSIDDCVPLVTTADLTIAKETDPAGGTGFPFTLDPGAVSVVDTWGSNGIGQGDFNGPFGVAVDGDGNVYVTDVFAYRVQKFDADGDFILMWGKDVQAGGVTTHEICLAAESCKAGVSGTGNGEFNIPHGIAIDEAGNVYVADKFNNRIQRFDTSGNYLGQWGSVGSGNGEFDRPSGVAVDAAGNVYVADTDNDRVQKFSAAGGYLGQWGSGYLEDPYGLAVYGTTVYIASTFNNTVFAFTTDGTHLGGWNANGSGNGPFDLPYGIATDSAGNVYVTDSGKDRVLKFDSLGSYLFTSWGSAGSGDGQFSLAMGVAVAANGDVYVVDYEAHRVQRFSQTGVVLDDGEDHEFADLAPGTYLITELVPDGWTLDDIDCGAATVTESGSTVSVTLAAGDDVTCTFSNVEQDTAAPDTTIDSGPTGTTNDDAPSFTFSSDEPGSAFECKLDGGGWEACDSGTQSYIAVGDGEHTFQVRACDALGNCDPTPASRTWTIDTAAPTVTINQASGQSDPTSSSPINFTVVFSEAVTGFATGDVSLSGTAGATTATVSGGPTTYNVAVSGMTGSGTVIATVAANVAEDAALNGNEASTSTDNTVTYNVPDTTPPTVTINQASGQSDPTSSSPINFTVVFSEPVTGFATSDVSLSGTAGATTATVSGGPTTYNVAVSGMTQSGTVIATIAADVAQDGAGNDNAASTSTDNSVTYNAPVVTGGIYVTAAGGSVPGAGAYQKNDILKFDGSAWSVWFDGATAGMKPTTDIMAFDVDDDADGSAWVVIRQAQQLPGVGKMQPQQVAYYNGSTWTRFFDGRDVGLLTTGERINGLEVLPGNASPIGSGCLYYLLITTTAAGGVPVGGTNVNFTGEDVLGFCMTQAGVNTAGTWHVAFEGQSQGLQKNNNLGLSANGDGGTLYFTVKQNFTGDGGLVRPSQLFSFSGGVFSGPLWKAADHGLTQQVDGIDVVGSIP